MLCDSLGEISQYLTFDCSPRLVFEPVGSELQAHFDILPIAFGFSMIDLKGCLVWTVIRKV